MSPERALRLRTSAYAKLMEAIASGACIASIEALVAEYGSACFQHGESKSEAIAEGLRRMASTSESTFDLASGEHVTRIR